MTRAQSVDPRTSLAQGLVVYSLEGVDRAVGCLALDRHGATIVKPDDYVSTSVAEFALPTERAGRRCGVEAGHGSGTDLLVAELMEQVFDSSFLHAFGLGSTRRLDLASRDQYGGSHDRLVSLVICRFAFLAKPRKAVWVDEVEHYVPNAVGLLDIATKGLGR